MSKAGVTDPNKCFFIDDSRNNVAAAIQLGWGRCVHFCEAGLEVVEGGMPKQIGADGKEAMPGATVIGRLEELRTVWNDVFKKDTDDQLA